MRQAVRVVLILVLVGIVALIIYEGWRRNGPNQFEAAFNPGGTVSLDLATGAFTIRGTSENKIWVEIDPHEDREVHCRVSVNGTRASVQIDGPSNNFNAVIFVPQRSDLEVEQTIGDLVVTNIEGNKKLGLNIGQLHVEVPGGGQQPSFDGSIVIGDLRAHPWRVEKGGFFRDYYTRSSGPYRLKAHVDIGDLEVVETGSHAQKSEDTGDDVSEQDTDDTAQ